MQDPRENDCVSHSLWNWKGSTLETCVLSGNSIDKKASSMNLAGWSWLCWPSLHSWDLPKHFPTWDHWTCCSLFLGCCSLCLLGGHLLIFQVSFSIISLGSPSLSRQHAAISFITHQIPWLFHLENYLLTVSSLYMEQGPLLPGPAPQHLAMDVHVTGVPKYIIGTHLIFVTWMTENKKRGRGPNWGPVPG